MILSLINKVMISKKKKIKLKINFFLKKNWQLLVIIILSIGFFLASSFLGELLERNFITKTTATAIPTNI